MPTTLTVKDIIKSELLKVCKEVTSRLRDKDTKNDKKRKFSLEKVAEIEKLITQVGWSGENHGRMLKTYSILHDAPELKAGSMRPLELFAVVLIGPGSHHAYPTNTPLMVSGFNSGKDALLWNPSDGAITNWIIQPSDNPVYATDDQVEQCINDMTAIQWTKFYTHDVFKPILDAAMNKAVTVEDEPTDSSEPEGNGEREIKLKLDGRTITMAG